MASQRPNSAEIADPRRIAACLKACEGIPTEKLESGAILRLVAACVHVDDAQVRSAVEDLVTSGLHAVSKSPR